MRWIGLGLAVFLMAFGTLMVTDGPDPSQRNSSQIIIDDGSPFIIEDPDPIPFQQRLRSAAREYDGGDF